MIVVHNFKRMHLVRSAALILPAALLPCMLVGVAVKPAMGVAQAKQEFHRLQELVNYCEGRREGLVEFGSIERLDTIESRQDRGRSAGRADKKAKLKKSVARANGSGPQDWWDAQAPLGNPPSDVSGGELGYGSESSVDAEDEEQRERKPGAKSSRRNRASAAEPNQEVVVQNLEDALASCTASDVSVAEAARWAASLQSAVTMAEKLRVEVRLRLAGDFIHIQVG